MTIRSTNGLIQEHEGMIWLLFKGYTLFLEPAELDEIIALLQAFQQERDLKRAIKVENLPTLEEIAQKAG